MEDTLLGPRGGVVQSHVEAERNLDPDLVQTHHLHMVEAIAVVSDRQPVLPHVTHTIVQVSFSTLS